MFKHHSQATYELSETQLIIELRSAQPQAVAYWFKTYHDRLLSFVLTKVTSENDAEEIVQETFINSLKQLPLFRGESSLNTWMQSIARHEVADYYRKKYAKKAIQSLPLTDVLAQALLAGKVQDSHEVSEKVKAACHTLSEKHRELLLLKYVDNKKVEDIAEELGKSVKSIESELFRARQAFKLAFLQVSEV